MRRVLVLAALLFALPAYGSSIYVGEMTGAPFQYRVGLVGPEDHQVMMDVPLGRVTVEAETTPGLVTISSIGWEWSYPGVSTSEAEGVYVTQFEINSFDLGIRWEPGVTSDTGDPWEIRSFDASRRLNFTRWSEPEDVPTYAAVESFFDGYVDFSTPLSLGWARYDNVTVDLMINAQGEPSWIEIHAGSLWVFDQSNGAALTSGPFFWEAESWLNSGTGFHYTAPLQLVPEPSTALLLAGGLAGFALRRRIAP